MKYEDWLEMTKLMISFNKLSKRNQQVILLMMDGFKYRAMKKVMD